MGAGQFKPNGWVQRLCKAWHQVPGTAFVPGGFEGNHTTTWRGDHICPAVPSGD